MDLHDEASPAGGLHSVASQEAGSASRREVEGQAVSTPTNPEGAEGTHALDAQHPAPAHPAPAHPAPSTRAPTDALPALMARRRQLAAMIAAERSRLRYASPRIRERVESHLLWLRRELAEIDEGIDAAVAERPHMSRREEILRTVPGFGPGVSATLVAELPELGRLSRTQIAALVGVSPHRSVNGAVSEGGPSPDDRSGHDAGGHTGDEGSSARRPAHADPAPGARAQGEPSPSLGESDRQGVGQPGSSAWGRERVRAMLYMATLTAIRVNPMIRPYYRRLRSSGKPAQVAVTASMRKLLTAANSMVREDTGWVFPRE